MNKTNKKVSRIIFLFLSSLFLQGCACELAWQDTEDLHTPLIPESGLTQWIDITPDNRIPIPEIVDVHMHFFNFRDLPLKGIIESKGTGSILASVIARAFVFLTDPSILRQGDLSQAEDILKFCEDCAESLNQELTPRMSAADWNALSDYVSQTNKRMRRFDAKSVHRILESTNLFKLENSDSRKDAKKNFFQAFRVLRSNSSDIVRESKRLYPEVKLRVHHMMDLGKTYGQKPKGNSFRDFRSQVERMEKLDQEFSGELVHFVAFDPFRDDPTTPENEALTLVKEAIDKHGAIGVKVYCPSGFRPTGNEIPEEPSSLSFVQHRQWASRYEGRSNSDLDKTLDDLYDFCCSRGLPIFTHTTPKGFEACDGYGRMGSPAYWEKVLIKHTKLTICFGHAGGDTDWFGGKIWPTGPVLEQQFYGVQVARLLRKYENTYAEFGIHQSAFDVLARKRFVTRLKTLFETTSSEEFPYKIERRIMYGSDWPMLSQYRAQSDYLNIFLDIFSQPSLRDHARKFFRKNALRYLNLKASG